MSSATNPNCQTSLLIVILNYRTPSLTINCLRSLVSEVQSLPNTRVIVTDNDSGDGSVEQIKTAIKTEGWGDWASVMSNEYNGGFAYGNNAAIRPALQSKNPPPYFMVLNPDTVVRPNAIKALMDFMNKHPDVGIAGSRLEDPEGTPQASAFRFHTVFSELDYGLRLGVVTKLLSKWVVAPPPPEEACETDWVAGASMIIRREVFESIGLMDEEYFMYYEETDFCLQAKRAGWSCWYVPESRIVHFVGQSSGVTYGKRQEKRRPQYWFDSRRRYFIKNYSWLYTALADHIWASSFVLWRVYKAIRGLPDRDPPQFLRDFIRNSVLFKGTKVSPPKIS